MNDFEKAKVLVKQGWLQGYIDKGLKVFKGIPYAAPPVGKLRWRPPRPAAPWEGVRDCARPGPRCPQLGVGKGSFS